MQKLLHLPIALCMTVPTACSEVGAPEPVERAGSPSEEQALPPESFFNEVVILSAAKPHEEVDDSELGSRAAGVQLARMAVSESTSLQPLNDAWQLDMQGILQVARNTQGSESLLGALKELSPHVGAIKAYTDERQPWTSTLPSRGLEAPELWIECTGWETVRGRKRGVPSGCHGVWELGADNWVTVRTYAISLVQMKRPPVAVQGKPVTWGGIMDIARFLKERPNLCWLESGPTTNYFFGLKTDATNTCKHMPDELIVESKLVSADIVARSLRRKALEE